MLLLLMVKKQATENFILFEKKKLFCEGLLLSDYEIYRIMPFSHILFSFISSFACSCMMFLYL